MRLPSLTLSLALSLAGAALIAACGETTPTPQTPSTPSATAPMTATPPATTTAAPTATTAPTTPPTTSATAATPPAKAPLMPISASAMAGDLKDAGLDIAKLQPMSKMKTAEKSKVMKAISKATGMECKGCHVEGDFKKDTPNKLIARHMWDEYVVPNKLADGGVFCDSCHHGKSEFLDRSNKDAISAYMTESYTKKLSRKDGKDNACPTCHTADFEMKIFAKVWKIQKLIGLLRGARLPGGGRGGPGEGGRGGGGADGGGGRA